MATLEEAAHVAVLAVRQLAGEIHQAIDACAQAQADVDAAARQLETDRADLRRALDGLESDLADAHQKTAPQVSAAIAALGSLGQAAREVASDGAADPAVTVAVPPAAAALEAESASLEAVADRLREVGPALEPVATSAASACAAALARAGSFEEALHQVVDDAEQLVMVQRAGDLVERGEALTPRLERIEAVLGKACPAFVEDQELDWDRKWVAARQLLDKVFQDMKEHAADLAEQALDECLSRLTLPVDETATVAEEVEMQARELAATGSAAAPAFDDAPLLLSVGLTALAASAARAAELVTETRVRWAAQGFGVAPR